MRHLVWSGLIVGLILCAFAFLAIQWARANARADRAVTAQRQFCERQLLGLETTLSAPDHFELSASMQRHYLNQATLKMCLDNDVPLDIMPAGECWVSRGLDECYVTLANELRDLYRARYR